MEEISHTGTVVKADADFITVSIVSEAACGSCSAKGLCGVGEQSRKQVVVAAPSNELYSVGDEVEVTLKASMGHKAVWYAYAIPLVVLVAVVMIFIASGAGELLSALLGIAAVAVYYFVLWLLRSRLQDQYEFKIRKHKTDIR